MDEPREDGAIVEIANEISPPSAKRARKCVQSKLSWHKPPVEEATVLAIEEEKEKCEESKGEGKKKGKSRARTPKKLPWHNPRGEEEKVIVIEEREEPQESGDEGLKKGKKRKSEARTPQKSPAKNKEARRSSARNKKGNQNCQNEQTGEDTPKTSPASRDIHYSRSSSKKSLNNKRTDLTKDVDGQNMNIHRPLTDLWLEAKFAAEENLRLSAGKQTHPFFTSRKATKRLPETQEIKKMEMRCWPGLDGDYTVSCPPIHVLDTSEDDIASFDWKSWVFTETFLSDLNGYHAVEKASSVFDGSVKPLILDNLRHEGMHQDQLPDKVYGQPLCMATGKTTSIDGQQFHAAGLCGNTYLSPGHVSRVDNLGNKQQDRLLMERLTSYYQRISCWPECSLWTNKYQPENSLEVCGNSDAVSFLTEWLKSWNERVLQSNNKKNILEYCATEESEDSTYEIESDMDDEATLKHVLLITGPVGSGKSAAIYACAKEQGYEVIEVNTSDVRNGAHLKQVFGQAMDSHALNKWSVEDPNGCRRKHIFDLLSSPTDIGEDEELGNGSIEMASRSCKQDATQAKSSWNTSEKITISQAANKSLILFEDVDTIFDEDRGFIASILQLAETTKRPIILTSNYRKPVLPQLLDHFVLDFTLPSSEELLSHLRLICASENAHVSSDVLEHLVSSCLGDVRKTLMLLQFWCQGRELQIDRNTQISYSPLDFDIDAAYSMLPRLIPWELQCKLAEKVVEEIDKASAMVEQRLQQMEVMPPVLSSMEMVNLPKKQNNVATLVKPRKRALFKRNPSFLDSTELLDHANDLEDFSYASNSPETSAQQTVKRRSGIILSSQSDDGSADERPSMNTMTAHQMPDMSTSLIPQTSEVNLLELLNAPICRFEGEDTVQRPPENFETASVSHVILNLFELPSAPICRFEGQDTVQQPPENFETASVSHEVLNLLELPSAPICRFEGQDTVQQPLENFETASVSHEVLNLLELPSSPVCRFEGHDTVQQPLENFETASVSHEVFNILELSSAPVCRFEGQDMVQQPLENFETASVSHEVLNLMELPSAPIGFEGQVTVQQPLENFEAASVSHVCDTFKLQDVSCVPESSFVSGTESNREDDFLAISSHSTSFNLVDSIRTIHDLQGDTNNLDRTIIDLGKCLEVNAVSTFDIDVESVNGNEEQGDRQNGDECPSYSCQLLDECSRVDFIMQLLPGRTSQCSLEVDLIQETWRKLRNGRDDLKSCLSANRKDASLAVNHVSGLADMISEADIMFRSCYPLLNDILEPSMTPSVEPDICSCYEDQMEIGSTYAQHGLCFYTSRFAEVGTNLGRGSTMDLALEMLASSMNTMALGKLLSKGKTTSQNLHLEGSLCMTEPRPRIPTRREMESELQDAILSTVPARLSMVPRDSAFHDYVSFLSKLSRLECYRLSQSTERRKRSRASRHYLSSGPLSLSDKHVQLLAQSCCFKS